MAVEDISTLRPMQFMDMHSLYLQIQFHTNPWIPFDKSSMRLLFQLPIYQYVKKIARIANSTPANASKSQWNIVSLHFSNLTTFFVLEQRRTKFIIAFLSMDNREKKSILFFCVCAFVCLKFSPKPFPFSYLKRLLETYFQCDCI